MYPGAHARLNPDKPAVVDAATGAAITYRELDQASIRLARALADQGLRPGDHIAAFMENHLRYFEVAWAALRSGLYLTTVNRYLTGPEAAYIVEDCGAQVLVSSRTVHPAAAGIPGFVTLAGGYARRVEDTVRIHAQTAETVWETCDERERERP